MNTSESTNHPISHSRAVVSMGIQPVCQALRALNEPTFQSYAERIGADYVCIEENLYPDEPEKMMLNKLQIKTLLERYERLIYLDMDIVVSPICRNLFEEVPEDCLGVWMQPPNEQAKDYIQKIQENFGFIEGWSDQYFNAGVMVVSRAHAALFDRPADLIPVTLVGNWISDQHFLNWNSRRLGLSFHILPNVCNWNPEQRWLNPWAEILHFWRNGFEWPALWSGPEIPQARLRQIAYLLQLWDTCSPANLESGKTYFAASQQWSLPFRPPLELPKLDTWLVAKFENEKTALRERILALKEKKEHFQIQLANRKKTLLQSKEKTTELKRQLDLAKIENQTLRKKTKPLSLFARLFK